MPFICDRPDLITPEEVPDFAGCPASYFDNQTARYVLPERVSDADVLEALGLKMFMESDFRPAEPTPYALAALQIITAKRKPTKSATDFGEHPLYPEEVEQKTGFTLRQVASVAGHLVSTERYLLKSEIIETVQRELEDGSVIKKGFVNRGHKLANTINGVRPVKPTDAFDGQREWSRAVNAAIVSNARSGYPLSDRKTIQAPWLEGGEMEREAFGKEYADMLLIHPDSRLPFELDERGRYIGHELYAETQEVS